jgi:hypothetical protein
MESTRLCVTSMLVFLLMYAVGAIPTAHPLGLWMVLGIGLIFGCMQFLAIVGCTIACALILGGLGGMLGMLIGPGVALWAMSFFTPVLAPGAWQCLLIGGTCVVLEVILSRTFSKIGR